VTRLPPKNVKKGLYAGSQWKIVVVITLERLVISTSNLAHGLNTQEVSRDMTPKSKGQRSKVKVTRSRNVFKFKFIIGGLYDDSPN